MCPFLSLFFFCFVAASLHVIKQGFAPSHVPLEQTHTPKHAAHIFITLFPAIQNVVRCLEIYFDTKEHILLYFVSLLLTLSLGKACPGKMLKSICKHLVVVLVFQPLLVSGQEPPVLFQVVDWKMTVSFITEEEIIGKCGVLKLD